MVGIDCSIATVRPCEKIAMCSNDDLVVIVVVVVLVVADDDFSSLSLSLS